MSLDDQKVLDGQREKVENRIQAPYNVIRGRMSKLRRETVADFSEFGYEAERGEQG